MKNIQGKTENLELFSKNGKLIYEFKNKAGYLFECTYNANGNELTYKDSDGYSYEYTYDANSNELTYENSNGVKRGFDIPEFTMEQLVEKLGNFKLVK